MKNFLLCVIISIRSYDLVEKEKEGDTLIMKTTEKKAPLTRTLLTETFEQFFEYLAKKAPNLQIELKYSLILEFVCNSKKDARQLATIFESFNRRYMQ